jgi:LacI family transcriptional regulator
MVKVRVWPDEVRRVSVWALSRGCHYTGMTTSPADPLRVPARVTLDDVAREATVSKATASRVLSGSLRAVGEETRHRVLEAAERLGYRADLLAQVTSKGTTPTVALVVGDIRDPSAAEVARGVIQSSAPAGLVVTIFSSAGFAADELTVLQALRGQAPRVTILASGTLHVAASRKRLIGALQAMTSTGGRVVVVGREGLPFDTVDVDDRAAAHELAAVVVAKGYRSPLFIGGRSDSELATRREEGVRAGLLTAGLALPAADVIRCAFDRDGAYHAVTGLDRSRLLLHDVIICGSDVMAVGAASALRGHGVRVGMDIGVTGFDDVPAASDVRPALTTVRVPWRQLGMSALELALSESARLPRIVVHQSEVILRDSTPGRR